MSGFGPDEGFGIGVPFVDPLADVCFELEDAAVGEAAEFAVGQWTLFTNCGSVESFHVSRSSSVRAHRIKSDSASPEPTSYPGIIDSRNQ